MTKLVIISIFVLAVAGIAAFIVVRGRTSQAQSNPGFREFVKNPDLWNDMIALSEEEQALADESDSWDGDQIVEAVERFIFGAESKWDMSLLGRQLRELSPRTHEALLDILRDKSREAKLLELRPADFLEEAPLMKVCELFDGNMPPEAIELLTPYLSHESDLIRKECVLAIAESGRPEALPAIKQSLGDEDEFVRSYALMGMKRAMKAGKFSTEIGSGVIADLERLVTSDLNVKDAARLMAQIDPAHAESFLLSKPVLDSQNRYLHEVLRVVGQYDFAIPRGAVKDLVAAYAEREMKYPNTYALGESLALLGKFKSADDEQMLQQYSNHEEDRVSDGAARGLLAFHNLQRFEERIWQQEEAGGWDSLNKEQQMYIAVFWLNSEVNNGGHSQYFFNSGGDNWQAALDGLEAMGFKDRLEIFKSILGLFGDQKPFVDRGKRQGQLATVYSDHEETFDRLDAAYYKSKESVAVHSMRFVLQNADKFNQ